MENETNTYIWVVIDDRIDSVWSEDREDTARDRAKALDADLQKWSLDDPAKEMSL